MKRIPVPVTGRLQVVLDKPSAFGLADDLSQAQLIASLAEEAIGLREDRIRMEARRARYSQWAADTDYRRAVAEDSAIALSEKAI